MRKLGITALLLLGLIALLAVLACEGDVGPQGPKGTEGEPGEDAEIGIPADMTFSLAIFNGTEKDHNGANLILLTFDSTASSSKTVVVANRVDGPPVIDGIDEGTAAWGDESSTLDLTGQAYADNFIDEAFVRAAYDDNNVYFLVRWTEVDEEDFEVGINDSHLDWVLGVVDTLGNTDMVLDEQFEDRLGLAFYNGTSQISTWKSLGCLSACHELSMSSLANSMIVDVWQWGAYRSEALGIALDRAITVRGFADDAGIPPYFRNFQAIDRIVEEEAFVDSMPLYMHTLQSGNPNYIPDAPLWDYLIVPFDEEMVWNQNSFIPGWILQTPSEGNDLITAKGNYHNGTWTVEFSRTRRTSDPYDTDF